MPTPASPIITVEWLVEHAGDPGLVIADVRSRDAYQSGHLPGAIHADLATLRLASSAPEAIAAWTAQLQATVDALGLGPEKLVVFHEDISGPMAAFGVWLLDAAGLRNGAMLDGGIQAWQGAGHPLVTDEVRPVATSSPIEPDLAVLETADQILGDLNEAPDAGMALNLVDTRGANEFAMGAIPGAVHVDWTRNLSPNGQFRTRDDLAAIYDAAGLDPSQPVATYCAGGFRAANTYVVLKALGYTGARNYAPSWGEWGQRPDTPKARGG